MKIRHNIYTQSITLENIFQAWDEFIVGKNKKVDVQRFARYLEDNLFTLYRSLNDKSYRHGRYRSFYVRDPKVRHISKACVSDRVVHHLVSRILENIFDPTFYAHSYSCRKAKGTHKGVEAFKVMARKVSKNNTSSTFVLKCDVKKFFASVDQNALLGLLQERIADKDFLWLLSEIVRSFKSELTEYPLFSKGMPIGNLTSQIFANIYLDPLDQFIKHSLKVKYYIRYADDFVILSENQEYLKEVLVKIEQFLKNTLQLKLHPNKVTIEDYYLGIDFLGYIVFPHYTLPRTKTKKRAFKKLYKKIELYKTKRISYDSFNQSLQSYLGFLSHADSHELVKKLKNQVLFKLSD